MTFKMEFYQTLDLYLHLTVVVRECEGRLIGSPVDALLRKQFEVTENEACL